MDDEEGMTLRELIAGLTSLGPDHLDKKIYTEGCDCWGRVGSITMDDKSVTLELPA